MSTLTAPQLRQARAELGWSQRQLAAAANLAVSTVAEFERGVRASTAANLDAMRAALAGAGVVFAEDGGPVPRPMRLGNAPLPDGLAWSLITASDFAQWTGLAPQGLLPRLLELLVRAGAGTALRLCRFPWGDSVQHGGPDAEVDIDPAGIAFPPDVLPQGRSLWELTTQSGPLFGKNGKASSDADKRRRPLSAEEAATTTFVFVTTQRVSHRTREEWVKTRRATDGWREVRMIDADALASWVNQFPSVLRWLAEKMGKPWAGCRRLEDAWNDWTDATKPPLSGDFLLLGRDEAAAKVWTWLHGDGAAPLFIEGETVEEVFAFVAATIKALPDVTAESLMARAVIADTAHQARRLAQAQLPHLLLFGGIDPQGAYAAARRGHRVIAAYPSRGGGFTLTGAIALPRPRRFELQQLLENALPGPEHARRAEAARLAKGAGGSLGILRRHLMGEWQNPAWVASAQAPSLRAALLVGGWDEDNPQDCAVLSEIAGRPYEDVERDLIQWVDKPGDPLGKIGNTWKLTAPRDAFFLLAPCLTGGELDRFEAAVLRVLTEIDPALSLPSDQRWQAAIRGRSPRYSGLLRAGLCETLALLAVLPDRARPAEPDGAARAAGIVRRLLHDADAARWPSLSGHMMTLAEAAPEAFLDAIEQSLTRGPEAPVLELLRNEKGPFGGANHAHLLWALEILSASGEFIGRVGHVLARLVQFDPQPERSWANTPGHSLSSIFDIVYPRSPLPWSIRFRTFCDLMDASPELNEVWIGTLLSVLPGGHRAGSFGPFAEWRQFDTVPGASESNNDTLLASHWVPAACDVSNRLADGVQGQPQLWPRVVESFPRLMPEARATFIEMLKSKATGINDDALRITLRDELRQIIAHHRRFQDVGRVLPEAELTPLDEICNGLAPLDPIRRHLWLFVPGPLMLVHSGSGNWQDSLEEANRLRAAAVAEIWQRGGMPAIRELIAVADTNLAFLGQTIGASTIPKSAKDKLIREDFQKEGAHFPNLATGMIPALRDQPDAFSTVRQWVAVAQQEKWEAQATGRIMCVFRAAPRVWTLAAACGEDVERAYWQQTIGPEAKLAPEDVETFARKMLAAGRAASAFQSISALYRKAVAPEILKNLLEAAAKEEFEAQRPLLGRYDVQSALDALHHAGAATDDELAVLELKLLHHLLGPGPAKPLAIHRVMARDPALFCEVLSYVYRPADVEQVAAQGAARSPHDRRLSELSWKILHTWHTVPGLRDGVVDRRTLEDWITAARRRCQEAGLLPACDLEIGRMLAQAPPDAGDGIWPCRAVREMLRVFGSERIEDGLRTGEINRRGVTTRRLDDGGAQERALAEKYGRWASELAISAPRAAAVLRRIVGDYEAWAKREDDTAARHDW